MVQNTIKETSAVARWKYNFTAGSKTATLLIEVIAAENDGWRARLGISDGGKVIEETALQSEWFQSFEEAKIQAKIFARKYRIKWEPKHFVNDRGKLHKPGTPPPKEI